MSSTISVVPTLCVECAKPLQKSQKQYCSTSCSNIHRERLNVHNKPSKEQLKEDVKTLGVVDISRKYGFSHTSVRRWLVKFDLL